MSDDDTLYIGPEAISQGIFDGKLSKHQVYRLQYDNPPWPIFKIRSKLAAWHKPMRAEMERRQTATRERRAS
jgi:hypothetical protein